MKRCLVLSLCAVALAAFGISSAQAVVNVALNLRYTDPADPSLGGTWTLVAKTDTASSTGITGLVVRFAGGTMPAAGTVNGSIGHDINGGALVVGSFDHDSDPNTPTQTEFVYGQDPNDGLVANVGLAGTPAPWNGGQDPLDGQNVGAGTWDGSTIIATGAIANLSTRPAFFSAAANEDISGTITAATINLMTVRGDSRVTLGLEAPGGSGLLAGDTNRDGIVDVTDLGNLATNWQQSPRAWLDGNFNITTDNIVDVTDLGDLATNWQQSGTPPAIAAVPEPSAALLGLLSSTWLLARRRKQLVRG